MNAEPQTDPEFEPIYQPRPKKRWGLRLLLVLLLMLIGGGAAGWYYFGDTLFIDADQEIPLVRADGEPIKVRPESPGGMDIPDRDKLVYDRIPGAEEREPVERLLPPPETPLPVPTPPPALETQAEGSDVPPPATSPEAGAASATPTPTPLAPTRRASGTDSPPAPSATPPSTAPAQATAEVPAAPASQAPEVAEAPTIPAAPPPPTALSQEAQRKAAEVAARTPPPPAATPAGKSYQVQLAAVRARDRAEQEWARLRNGHKDLLGTLQLSVMRADLGPGRGIFYRLRVGPLKTESMARDLCRKLAERKVSCLVVRPEG
jgi:hypothetical protein